MASFKDILSIFEMSQSFTTSSASLSEYSQERLHQWNIMCRLIATKEKKILYCNRSKESLIMRRKYLRNNYQSWSHTSSYFCRNLTHPCSTDITVIMAKHKLESISAATITSDTEQDSLSQQEVIFIQTLMLNSLKISAVLHCFIV